MGCDTQTRPTTRTEAYGERSWCAWLPNRGCRLAEIGRQDDSSGESRSDHEAGLTSDSLPLHSSPHSAANSVDSLQQIRAIVKLSRLSRALDIKVALYCSHRAGDLVSANLDSASTVSVREPLSVISVP